MKARRTSWAGVTTPDAAIPPAGRCGVAARGAPPAEFVKAGRQDRTDQQEAAQRTGHQQPSAQRQRQDRETAKCDHQAVQQARTRCRQQIPIPVLQPGERPVDADAPHGQR